MIGACGGVAGTGAPTEFNDFYRRSVLDGETPTPLANFRHQFNNVSSVTPRV